MLEVCEEYILSRVHDYYYSSPLKFLCWYLFRMLYLSIQVKCGIFTSLTIIVLESIWNFMFIYLGAPTFKVYTFAVVILLYGLFPLLMCTFHLNKFWLIFLEPSLSNIKTVIPLGFGFHLFDKIDATYESQFLGFESKLYFLEMTALAVCVFNIVSTLSPCWWVWDFLWDWVLLICWDGLLIFVVCWLDGLLFFIFLTSIWI